VEAGALLATAGTIAPAKPFVTLVLDRRHGKAWEHFRRIVIDASTGDFAKKVRLRKAGLYRVRARFDGDESNGPVRSATYRVRVPHTP
jgi:hypothetical protein